MTGKDHCGVESRNQELFWEVIVELPINYLGRLLKIPQNCQVQVQRTRKEIYLLCGM